VVRLQEEGERLLGFAQAATVTDLDTAKHATNDVTIIRGTLRMLEEKRKAYKAPLLEAGRELDRYFNGIADPFQKADKTYSDKVIAYHREVERQRLEAVKINEAVQAEVVEVPDQQKHVRAEAGTMAFTWVADKDRIQAAIDSGAREIPGIHIYPVWQYKVLKLDQVPEEYKRQSTRVTR